MSYQDILIVGGGHGGAQAAIALRQQGFDGSITIVSDESELPYERPPLSKEYLAGEKPFERILIRPAAFWDDRRVKILFSTRVIAVDATGHSVESQDGTRLAYGRMIWATGGSPRRLVCDGGELDRVHSVRSRSDVDRMMGELPDVRRIVLIGGGYIGLEAAAVLTKLGKQVVLLEALPRVLARVAGEPISRFYKAEHRSHGVDVRTAVVVDCIEGEGGRAVAVRLAGGELLPADMVIVGIGIVPSIEPLVAAGASASNGVHVDEMCRTTLPDVFAVGDCAAHENRYADGARIRLESVQNANDQAVTAAKAIVGKPEPYVAVPWFWSNQYDLKLQTVGLSLGSDEVIVRGDPSARSFSVIYLRDGRVIALDCVNAMKDYAQGKALVQLGPEISREALSDTATPLKALL